MNKIAFSMLLAACAATAAVPETQFPMIRAAWEKHNPLGGEFEDGRYVVLLYRADRFSGTLRASEEGEVFWAALDELPGMNLASNLDDTLKVYLNDDLSECQYYLEDGAWRTAIR